jgi:YHYH protein
MLTLRFSSLLAFPFLTLALLLGGCSGANDIGGTSSADTTSGTGGGATASGSTAAGFKQAKWGANVTITYGDTYIEYKSNGIPDHERATEYAIPNAGVMIPTAATAHAGADPTKAQSYDFKLPNTPKVATKPTAANLGTIGLMISGAALYNPYEADNMTVALASNFTVKDASGNDVAFLDACNGHPNPMGAYHYHGLPACITAKVDTDKGASHIIGIAFDGYPIYGNKDADGNVITSKQLDACNGITSPTPEFPSGIYHYVLLAAPDSTSSIKCFTGEVDPNLMHMIMGPPGGGPPMGP